MTGKKLRFIPTYVGHTRAGSPPILRRTVHPHIRGAYAAGRGRFPAPPGSSPHTWGIRKRRNRVYSRHRFIPTYVGHTRRCTCPPCRCTVHPHIRGAYALWGGATTPTRGSSPHTWGIPNAITYQSCSNRFIPTYVGHTRSWKVPGKPSAVHPHIRGAYHQRHRSGSCIGRFIPTYVGHTCPLCHTLRCNTVHPHIRGAYCSASAWGIRDCHCGSGQ